MRSRILSALAVTVAAGATAAALGFTAAGAASAAVSTTARPSMIGSHDRLDELGGVRGERAGLPLHHLDHHGPGHLVR